MAIQRGNLYGGPGKIIVGASTPVWSADDIEMTVEPSTNDVETSMFGRVDETIHDLLVRVRFTPFGLWENLTTLIPTFYTNPVIGSRLMGDSDTPLKVWSNNGDLYTVTCAGVTKPPMLYLGPDKPVFGQVEFTGVLGNNKSMDSLDAYYKIQTAQPEPTGAFSMTNYKQQEYSASWGSVTGFTAFEAQDGWQVEIQPRLEPVLVQAHTVDFKLASVTVAAKCKPVGPTAAQIEAAMKYQGSGNKFGHRLGSGTVADLTISSAGVSVVIANAALKTAGFIFGGKPLRNGEVAFVNTVKFTTGTPAAIITIT